ncbi:hypothetical protein DCS_05241 [Drechmeria coniospora]|uniref:Cytoskeleton-associated protein n=1 Tax=Drechmeria coniospora TaxID=98403 RepID=A0A151GMC3_DRECN|nr:hypothetical protein DCS_05241 [Drechmeria coniospora]KYK58228.1 hypothetical protein DCS_05241 [Drechmeria coniospora]ODA82937.1 hypothetical protein RJ55_01446 [Drechmeria coniospora]
MGWYSSLVSLSRDERVILVAFGLASLGIVSTIVKRLKSIRDQNEILPFIPKTQYITQDTEDALHLDTLDKLLRHPNFSVREVATKILCDRAINDPETTTTLLYGITRPDGDERIRCLRALALLTGQTMELDGLSKLHDAKAYSALVRSLELSLQSNDPPDLSNSHWDEYHLRDMDERFCLMFILELVNKYGAYKLVMAKFVEKWLAKQDWGREPKERRRRFREYMKLKSNRLVDIVTRIKQSKRGLRALEDAGLMAEDGPRRPVQELPKSIKEVEEDTGEQLADQQPLRAREHSAEERRLRRQHREAMVLNDGTRPLGREDIIERDHGSPT